VRGAAWRYKSKGSRTKEAFESSIRPANDRQATMGSDQEDQKAERPHIEKEEKVSVRIEGLAKPQRDGKEKTTPSGQGEENYSGEVNVFIDRQGTHYIRGRSTGASSVIRWYDLRPQKKKKETEKKNGKGHLEQAGI